MRGTGCHLLALHAMAGCVVVEQAEPRSASWVGEISSLLEGCRSCHREGGALPDLGTYPSAIGCRRDGVPYARSGDPESLILTVSRRTDHADLVSVEQAERFRAWVEGGLVYASSQAHPEGFAAPSTPAFHGDALRLEGYRQIFDGDRTDACGTCHDKASTLGGAVPCSSCHSKPFSPERCDACHGSNGDPSPSADPCAAAAKDRAIGLHALHTRARAERDPYPTVPCSTCHLVPRNVGEPGHVGDGTDRAEVRFDPEALNGALEEARYDDDGLSCSVSCHGDRVVAWTQRATSEACDRCHGAPPPGHASDRCARCHTSIIAEGDRSILTQHIDGNVDVGTSCTDCHGGSPSPGFPGDPSVGVGAHEAHLRDGALTRAADCETCHFVPERAFDPGHIDSDLPAEVLLSGDRATSAGATTPRWDPVSGRCSDVVCHGANLDGGAPVTPSWSDARTSTALQCGDCHGLPPLTVRGGSGIHIPTGPAECGVCHRSAAGEPITSGVTAITADGRSAHVNGCVDLESGCR